MMTAEFQNKNNKKNNLSIAQNQCIINEVCHPSVHAKIWEKVEKWLLK